MEIISELRESYKKISTKKITRRLVSQYYYIKSFLIIGILTVLLVLVISFFSFSKAHQNYLVLIPFLIFILYTFLFYFQIINKAFMHMEAHKRQFYILFLMFDIIKSNDSKKKYKLWSLISWYRSELNKIINQYRNQHVFEVQNQERDIIILNNGFSEKIIGNMLDRKYEDEISIIIENLTYITYLINNDEYILKSNNSENININLCKYNVDEMKKEIYQVLDKIEVSHSKIKLMRVDWLLQFLSKRNIDLILVLILTGIVIGSYLILSIHTTNTYSIDTIYEILIGAPMAIMFFINLFKRR